MSRCYMCGCQVREGEGRRRHIVTGRRSSRLRFGERHAMRDDNEVTLASERSEFRLLCAGCAADHDAQQRRALFIGLAIAGFFLLLFAGGAFFVWNRIENENQRMRQDFDRDRKKMEDDFERQKRNNQRDQDRQRPQFDQ